MELPERCPNCLSKRFEISGLVAANAERSIDGRLRILETAEQFERIDTWHCRECGKGRRKLR